MITCGLDVIKVYNTYFSHQNVCFALKLKYSHCWIRYTVSGTPKKHEDERYCMSFRQKYFHHWKHKYFDHWTERYFWSLIEENLGLATGFSEVRAALAICPNLEAIKDILKQQNHNHHNHCTHHDHNDCHNHRSKLITILL